MEYKVILHDEYQELKKKSEEYAEKLSELIEEYSYIISHEYNKILTEYILKIGALECEEFEIYIKIETLKRKIQFITAFINRGEVPNLSTIEEQLEKDFYEYDNKLQTMEEDLELAKILEATEYLSLEDVVELKRLYKNLVKKLHPDVNTNATEKENTLWFQALEAYQNGNLEMLGSLTDIVDTTMKDPIDSEIENALEIVRGRCDRLNEKIEAYIIKIVEIKNTFPFDKIDFLKDESQVKARKEELKEAIAEWNKFYLELEGKYKSIIVF